MFSQNFPISAAFTAILKIKLPQCNAIGVRTSPRLIWLTAIALLTHFKAEKVPCCYFRFRYFRLTATYIYFDQTTAFCFYYSFPILAFSLYHPLSLRGGIVKLTTTSFLKGIEYFAVIYFGFCVFSLSLKQYSPNVRLF